MADGVRPVLVACPQQADRPVGAEHDLVRSEDFQSFMKVGGDGFGITFAVGKFGKQAGKFHSDEVIAFRKFLHAGAPSGFDAAVAGFWLCDVVEDDGQLGLAINEFNGDWQLALKNQEVVTQSERGEKCEASMEIFTEEILIGFFLENVADGFEFWMGGKAS